MADIIIGV